jgi:hypothetical protein
VAPARCSAIAAPRRTGACCAPTRRASTSPHPAATTAPEDPPAPHQVIVETDGWEAHGTRTAFRADRAKDAALTASGYRVLRFTKDVEPDVAVRRLRALLA